MRGLSLSKIALALNHFPRPSSTLPTSKMKTAVTGLLQRMGSQKTKPNLEVKKKLRLSRGASGEINYFFGIQSETETPKEGRDGRISGGWDVGTAGQSR